MSLDHIKILTICLWKHPFTPQMLSSRTSSDQCLYRAVLTRVRQDHDGIRLQCISS